MLDRFRGLLQRLELPPEDEESTVYRILDDNRRVLEVSPSRYFSWRMRDDLAKSTIVGSGLVQDISVRTTFSIMPESKGYKPFGTSATHIVLFEPLTEYSQRYDTWYEAERGHRNVVERVGRDLTEAEAEKEIAQSFVGLAAELRELLSEPIPDLFSVARHGEVARVRTPLRRPDGSFIEVDVVRSGSGFLLSEAAAPGRADCIAYSDEFLEALDVVLVGGVLTGRAGNARQLGTALLRLGQAVAFHSRRPEPGV